MPYAQIDDKILDCPKALEAGEAATNLLIRMVIYCNCHLTDGRIPKAAMPRVTSMPEVERVPLLESLKKVNWIRENDDEFHVVGYLDHNPSRKTVEQKRKAAKQRKDKWKKEKSGTRSKNVPGTQPRNTTHSTPLHSTPLDPSPSEKEDTQSAPAGAAVAPVSPGPTLAEMRDLWNALLPHPPFPRWVELGPDQIKAAKRIRERPVEGESGWIAILHRIGTSAFCRGTNDRGWVADPDFLLRVATPRKVLEGKYDDRRGARATNDDDDRFARFEGF